MLLRIFSDLHLDVDLANAKNPWVPTVLPTDKETVLVLAGDFLTAKKAPQVGKWLDGLAQRFKAVVAVLGNHDYWFSHDWVTQHIELCEQVTALNVYVLEQNTITIDGVRFAGCTLWTDMGGTYEAAAKGKNYTWDLSYIQGMTADSWIREYHNSLDFLVGANADIIVTHYVPDPIFTHPKYKDEPGNVMFSSQAYQHMQYLYAKTPAIWAFGHTHDNYDKVINDTRFFCNPRGYGLENLSFNDKGLIEYNGKE